MRLSYVLLVVVATTLVSGHAAPTHGKSTMSLNQIQDESSGNKRLLRKYAVEDKTDGGERGILSFGTSNIVKHAGRSKKLDKKLDKMLADAIFREEVYKKWELKYKGGDIYVRLKVHKDGKYAEISNMYAEFLQRGAGMYHLSG